MQSDDRPIVTGCKCIFIVGFDGYTPASSFDEDRDWIKTRILDEFL